MEWRGWRALKWRTELGAEDKQGAEVEGTVRRWNTAAMMERSAVMRGAVLALEYLQCFLLQCVVEARCPQPWPWARAVTERC